MPWSALNDDNRFCRIHTLNASPSLFTMPSTLVMCLQIMVNPFQSASVYTKRRDGEPMKDPGFAICFQICHRGERVHKKKKKGTEKVKGGVLKKRSTWFLSQGRSCLSQKTQSQMTVKERRCSVLLQTCHTQTHTVLFFQTDILRWQSLSREHILVCTVHDTTFLSY